jgi:hypothetical protein
MPRLSSARLGSILARLGAMRLSATFEPGGRTGWTGSTEYNTTGPVIADPFVPGACTQKLAVNDVVTVHYFSNDADAVSVGSTTECYLFVARVA